MADLILSTDLDTFLGAANFAAARTALGVPGLATANTFTAVGAVSAPAVSFTGAPFTGGDATTTKPLLLIEPTGTTSNAWTTSGTMLGVNAASAFTGHLLSLRTNSTSAFSVDRTGQCTFQTSMGGPSFYESTGNSFYANSGVGGVQTKSAGFFGFSSDTTAYGTVDTALFRLGAANIRQGKAASATPIAQTLTIGEASRPGTDSGIKGGNATIQSGLGTGTTGGVSSLIFQTPLVNATATAVQPYATGWTVIAGAGKASVYTVATLPPAATVGQGGIASVSDATQAVGTAPGTAPTGGGAVKRMVYCDGAAWLLI